MAFPTSGSPNAGQLQIGIALVLQDRFSNQAREASASIRRLHQEAKNVTNANLGAIRSLASMGAAAGAAGVMGLAAAVKQGAEFVDTMTFVDAIAEKNGVTLEMLSKRARTLGRETMWTSQDIASAMQYFAMAGMDTSEIYNNIQAAANLAGSTMSALGGKGGTADILTNIMKMFRIESTEFNSTRVGDVLTKAVTSANISLYDLAESVKYAGTTVTNLGGSLEQTAAFIGVLGNAGIQGSMAGTAMANAYRYLSRSIADENFKGGKALRALGLSKEDFIDAQGRLIDIGVAMQKISKATAGMNDIDRYNTLISILGVRGERGGSAMIKAFEDYTDLLNKVQNESQGLSSQIIADRMDTIAGGLNKMTSAWENVITTFTESVAPTLTPIFNTFAAVFDMIGRILGTSYIGPAIAGLVTFGTLLVTVRLGILAARSAWRLMFNDSTVSFANMIAVMKQGWSQVTISAGQYRAMEAGIVAQRKAGIMASGAGVFASSAGMKYMRDNPKTPIGGIFYSKGRYFQKDEVTGGVKRVSAAAARAITSGKTPQQLGLLRTAAPAAAGVIGSGLLRGGLIRGIATVLRGALGIVGGPIGLGLTALTFFLPTIIDAIFGNKDSQDKNTDALNKNTDQQRYQRASEIYSPLTNEEKTLLLINALNNFTETIKGTPMATIQVNIDGTEIVSQAIDSIGSDTIVNIGGK